jgi:outer membrane protein OmpA-like peptidoglycan-associated protein
VIRIRHCLTIAAVVLNAACASTRAPASLTQAESLYQSLLGRGADQRVEAEMIRTRQAIEDARMAVTNSRPQPYAEGLARIALRHAQSAEAIEAAVLAQRATDSLQKARLNRLLSMSESQRSQLAEQQKLSQEEISTLRVRTLTAEQRADSLRRAVEEANARLSEALTQLRSLVAEITNIRETSRGLVISLSDVLFDVNSSTLRGGAASNVQKISQILNQYPDYKISVEGHTDSQGSDAYNQQLSQRRAASVLEALVAGGVPADRITSQGFGESQPVASNDAAAGRQQNRRVEVIVLGAGKVADAVRSGTGTTPPPR